jgi:hypothetical protein
MPPFINFELTANVSGASVSYTLDMIISSIILLKAYTLMRVYEHVSKWTNFDAKKITLPFGLETNYKFAFKSDVRSNNLLVYLIVGLVFIFIWATLMFNFESHF